MTDFNPYLEWLGIPQEKGTPDYYALLGLDQSAFDHSAIESSFENRMRVLKKFQSGPRGEAAVQIMEQVAKAKQVLLDEEKRREYDAGLRKQKPAAAQPQVAVPMARPVANEFGDEDDEQSVLSLLLDIRVLMLLLSTIVVVMTVTVLMLRDSKDKNQADLAIAKAQPSESANEGATENGGRAVDEGEKLQNESAENEQSEPANKSSAGKVKQAGDGTLSLPLNMANLTPTKALTNKGIEKWQEGDEASWQIETTNRFRGHFTCFVTYTADRESRFAVKAGTSPQRSFTVYAKREPFTEEFIVKLSGKDEQPFVMQALTVPSQANVVIQAIRLQPNK